MAWRLKMFGFRSYPFSFIQDNDCKTISVMVEVSYLVSLSLKSLDYISLPRLCLLLSYKEFVFFFDSFSILADGLGSKISEDGVAYYNSLINFLLEKGH